MSAKLFLGSTQLASESSGTITVDTDINMSSGKSIKNAAGTALLTEAGVLDNVALGSSVSGFPASGLTLIGTQDVTTHALSIDQSWTATGATAYETLLCVYSHLHFSASTQDGTAFVKTYSTDSSTAHNWAFGHNYTKISAGGVGHNTGSASTSGFWISAQNADGGQPRLFTGYFWIYSADEKDSFVQGSTWQMNTDAGVRGFEVYGKRLSSSDNTINKISFLMNQTGNIKGKVTVFGLKT